MKSPTFVAYFRVSTEKQGRSGLGLEAQQAAVAAYVQRIGGELVECFCEVESGKNDGRPELAAALAAARARGATLVIAKLDRLSRNLAFLAAFIESGVRFVACDMPEANEMTLQIMAVFAQHERKAISERTKAALAAAKARGVKLGNPALRAGTSETAQRARDARVASSKSKAGDVLKYVRAAQAAGATSLAQIGEALEARGVRTPRGGSKWAPAQVRRVLQAT